MQALLIAAWRDPIPTPWAHSQLSSALRIRIDLKPNIYTTPLANSRGGGKKT
jgi:hypothetical protein